MHSKSGADITWSAVAGSPPADDVTRGTRRRFSDVTRQKETRATRIRASRKTTEVATIVVNTATDRLPAESGSLSEQMAETKKRTIHYHQQQQQQQQHLLNHYNNYYI